jgi:hypothetical protein
LDVDKKKKCDQIFCCCCDNKKKQREEFDTESVLAEGQEVAITSAQIGFGCRCAAVIILCKLILFCVVVLVAGTWLFVVMHLVWLCAAKIVLLLCAARQRGCVCLVL